jgi:hypothetical protein
MLELTVHVIKDLLPAGLERFESPLCIANRNAILSISQTLPSGIGELVERHTEGAAVLDVGLMFCVMQFSYT